MSADVTLIRMLAARDERAAGQAALAERFGLGDDAARGAVVSVTLVTPGPDKNPPWATRVFQEAMSIVEALGADHVEVHDSPAGPHGLAAVTGRHAHEVKRELVGAEESHAWGRLFDLDVIVGGRPLQRGAVDAPARLCLVCDGPAAPCARARAHDLQALDAAIEELLCS